MEIAQSAFDERESVAACHRRIDSWLTLAREQLQMDVSFISELVDDTQTIRYLSRGTGTSGWRPGSSIPAADGFCSYVVSGQLPQVIPDARADPRTAALPASDSGDIGSYVGAPITLTDGTVFGALCATSARPDFELGDTQVGTLTFLAGVIGNELSVLEARLGKRRAMIAAFQNVIARSEFSIAFQPVVDLRTGQVQCVEALARFSTVEGGWVEMAAMADDPQLLTELELALAQNAVDRMRDEGGGCRLGLNVSPRTLLSDEFLVLVLNAADVPLTVEITEYSQLQDSYELQLRLAALRAQGATIAIDNAGSGYAGLTMIVAVRPDIIKLDLELVRNIDHDPIRRALVRSIVLFAADVGAKIIAEGIESEEELEAVRSTGCHLGQGYLLRSPTTNLQRARRTVDLTPMPPVPEQHVTDVATHIQGRAAAPAV